MTKDFSKYQQLLSSFRGQVSAPDFEAKFAEKTSKLPKSERFLLKMELKRLAGECTRLIDLRGHVDGVCKAYEYDGRTHYLDDVAIDVFEDNIYHYGKYTFGVYEAVKNTENNFRVMYEKEKLNLKTTTEPKDPEIKVFEKTQYPSSLVTFGNYADRQEERMNFAVALKVSTHGNVHLDGTSVDISVRGCRFRVLAGYKFKVGDELSIAFLGLEGEYDFGQEALIHYRVCNVRALNKTFFIGCQRILPAIDEKDNFGRFLTGFILANKRRYKINLDNTISALQSRTLEHFVMPKLNELPVFIQKTSQGYLPRYALTCANNKVIYNYWQNEQGHSSLDFLLCAERLERLVASCQDKNTSLLVYSFIHQRQGKPFFYSADEQQLADDKYFMRQYLGFSVKKENFAVYQLSIVAVNSKLAASPFTLADTLTSKDAYLNAPTPKETMQLVNKFDYIVTIKRLTNDELLPHYQECNADNIDVARLKSFGHKRHKQVLHVDEAGINYKNQRQEPRFKYVTPAIVSAGELTWRGQSADFSMSGLKIRLANSTTLTKGDVVHIGFPQLQKITKEFDLSALPYEVVSVNNKQNVLNCRVYIEQHQHIGRSFFKLLIEKNRDKLTSDEYTMMTPGLSKALRNIYSASLTSPFLIVQTSGSRYKIETIAASGEYGLFLPALRALSDITGRYNLYPLLSDLAVMNQVYTELKKLGENDAPISYTLYISINKSVSKVEHAVNIMPASTLRQPERHAFFIKNALAKGSFFAVQLKLSRTKKPDMDCLNPELAYISNYAIHRAKQLEQDIWTVVGVIELVDITKEVLTLYQLLKLEDKD